MQNRCYDESDEAWSDPTGSLPGLLVDADRDMQGLERLFCWSSPVGCSQWELSRGMSDIIFWMLLAQVQVFLCLFL